MRGRRPFLLNSNTSKLKGHHVQHSLTEGVDIVLEIVGLDKDIIIFELDL